MRIKINLARYVVPVAPPPKAPTIVSFLTKSIGNGSVDRSNAVLAIERV